MMGTGNGSSWMNAFTDLNSALAQAYAGDEVRIGPGTYRPSPNEQTASFIPRGGVRVCGGFAGSSAPNPDHYAPTIHVTVLDGDLKGDDFQGGFDDNAYHVVRARGLIELRGVTVRGGRAVDDTHGGGILCPGATLTIEDCIIESNAASSGGGGIYGGVVHMTDCIVRFNYLLLPTRRGAGVVAQSGSFTRCTFAYNVTATAGSCGGLWVNNAIVESCNFHDNIGDEDAGAIGGSNLTVANCTFDRNLSGYDGGAIVMWGGVNSVRNCAFTENHAFIGGGAFVHFGSSLVAEDCHFEANSAGGGGAIRLNGNVLIARCTFVDNVSNGSGGGGAISAVGTVRVVNCNFLGHTAWEGGAIRGWSRDLTVVNCFFSGNRSWDVAGAVYNGRNLSLINCTLVGNHSFYDPNSVAGQVPSLVRGEPRVSGAVYDNEIATSTVILNTVLWGNLSDGMMSEATQIQLQGPFEISNCIVHHWSGALGGTGNSGDDPHLVNPAGWDGDIGTVDDDPRVFLDSPVRNAGDNGALPPDWCDLDGDGDTQELLSNDLLEHARVQSGVVDIGAVELPSCPADIDESGTVDASDFVLVVLAWGSCAVAAPCPADINFSGIVDVDDLIAVILGWGACP
jgi:hypothetical protein